MWGLGCKNRLALSVFLAAISLATQGCTKDHNGTARPTSTVGETATPISARPGGELVPAPATGTPAAAGYVIADPRFDPLPGARALFGQLSGAAYQIEAPANWNGGLVLYAHGFTGNDPILFVQQPPLRDYFIEHGFAWAASSFSAPGYDPDVGLVDTLALRNLFLAQVGTPSRTYIDGTSMGGHVVVSAMEQHPELFSAGFSECGVVGGVAETDYLDSYVTLASYLTHIALLPIADATTYRTAIRSRLLPALGPADKPTDAGRQFEDVIKLLTGGPRPWRHEGFVDRRAANFDLAVTDDPKHPSLAQRAGTNAATVYQIDPGLGVTAEQLNAGVIRVPADPSTRNAQTHPDFAPRTGNLRAPLLTLHTTGDHFVPISQEQSYRRTVDAAGAADLLVQRAIRRPGHCQFSPQELQQGFADLVNWVEQGTVPAGDDFRNPDLSAAGIRFTQPLLPGDPGGE